MGHDRTTFSLIWDLIVSLVLLVGIIVVLLMAGLVRTQSHCVNTVTKLEIRCPS